jgi:predicted nucleotidyltransferase
VPRLLEPLTSLLAGTVGVETELAKAFERPDIDAAAIHGSWASGKRRPDSDIDVLAVGSAELLDLRRAVRPIGKAAGRTIDVTLLAPDEFRRALRENSSFARRILDGPTIPLAGDIRRLTEHD